MRFEMENGRIKEKEAVSLLRARIDGGVNYVDTAYFYLEGQSESLVGRALQDGYREKVHLATKSPVFALESGADFDRILDEQLERLQTETIDFYLLHTLSLQTFEEKVLGYKLLSKMEKARADGKIRYIGFSFHDNHEAFLRILNGYDGWDFCQLQLNYIDVENQAGLRGLEEAAAKGLGVIIMSPCSGVNWPPCPRCARSAVPVTYAGGMGVGFSVGSAGSRPDPQRHERHAAGGGQSCLCRPVLFRHAY